LGLGQAQSFPGATPRKRESGSAVAVVVNDDAAAELLPLNPHARFAKRSEPNALVENFRGIDIQNAATLRDDSRCRSRIDLPIVADFIRAAENTIVHPRNGVHPRWVVTNDCAIEVANLGHNGDLPAMWFEFVIVHERSRSKAGAIDHEI